MTTLAEKLFPPRIRNRVAHCKRDEYDVLVDRSTEWGNPKRLSDFDGGRARCLAAYLTWLTARSISVYDPQYSDEYDQVWVRSHVRDLRGKTLACWCAPRLCHGHVLAAMAAADEPLAAVRWVQDRLEEVS